MDPETKLTDDFDEEEVFFRASQITDPARQIEYVTATCKTPEQLELIKGMLAQDITTDFLEKPAVVIEDQHQNSQAIGVGSRLGAYTIEKQIGSGGFGDVFVASQSQPVTRTVAIKVLRQSTSEVVGIAERFLLEQQTLAGLEHPNIARLIDAGTTDDGLPYFVMEFIEGTPLDVFLRDQKVDLDQRLAIFQSICEAVSHAHQKGVIHRDLKPGNVLVKQSTDTIDTKVIDFGIAKLATLPPAEQRTLDGQVLGTPGYMAPEQVQSGSPVDTRADIYGLGAILYFMATGSSPLHATDGGKGNLHDAFRTIIEIDPPSATSLQKHLPSEIDWIARKAIRKRPEDRYASVAELATDIQRFRNGDAVSVGPPTLWYQSSKWIRRHRFAATAILAISASIIIGGIIATYGLLEANRALSAEQAATKEAERQRDQASQVGLLLSELAGASNTENNRPFDFPVRQVLQEFADELDTKTLPPEVEYKLRQVLGRSFFSYGQIQPATKNLRRCRDLFDEVNADAAERATTNLDYGRALFAASKFAEARKIVRSALASEMLDARGQTFAYHALSELDHQNEDGVATLENCRRALEKAKQIDETDPALVARIQSFYARALWANGQDDLAESESAAALKTIESFSDARDVDVATVKRNRALILRRSDLRSAGRLIQSARKLDEQSLGPSDRLVADIVVESDLFRQAGRMKNAARSAFEAMQLADTLKANRGAACLMAYGNAADLLESHDSQMAFDAWTKSCELTTELLGDCDRTVRTLVFAARRAKLLGKHEMSETWLQQALEIQRRSSVDLYYESTLLYSLACAKIGLGKISEAKLKHDELTDQESSGLKAMLGCELALQRGDVESAKRCCARLNEEGVSFQRRLAMEALILRTRVAIASNETKLAEELIVRLRSRASARRGSDRLYVDTIEALSLQLH